MAVDVDRVRARVRVRAVVAVARVVARVVARAVVAMARAVVRAVARTARLHIPVFWNLFFGQKTRSCQDS